MELIVLGSSSKGNCCLLKSDNKVLILEAGINPKEVLKEIDFNLSRILGVLVTHEHKDHSKYFKDYLNKGIKVFMTLGTAEALGVQYHHNISIIKKLDVFHVGNYKIMPFDVQHDAAEPVGFLINEKSYGNILFATDTYYIKYQFKDLRAILIEANYDEEILENSNSPYKDRIYKSHISIDSAIDFLKSNNLIKLEVILLIHLSDSHSNENDFLERVVKATGVNTIAANTGVKLDLSL